MASVTIHNISDRPNTPGGAVTVIIGGQKVRPGDHVVVDSAVVGAKHRELHGTRLWFGDLPARFTRTSKSALRAQAAEAAANPVPLTLQQVRDHLARHDVEELRGMGSLMSPPVDLGTTASKAAVIARLSRALFTPDRELDPQAFFWLGRWKAVRGGFVPVE